VALSFLLQESDTLASCVVRVEPESFTVCVHVELTNWNSLMILMILKHFGGVASPYFVKCGSVKQKVMRVLSSGM
jgi:hypothetical protein